MSNSSDFVIENSVLKKYRGPGGAVSIPEGVTSIERKAFSYCRGLSNVTIPKGVTSIGDEAFSNCTGLTSVITPEGVKTIREWAFYGCTNLASVTISEGVETIWRNAFQGCTGLCSVTILTKSEEIDKSLFQACRPVLIAPHIPITGFCREDKPGAVRGFVKLYFEKAEIDGEVRMGYLKYIKGQKKRLYPLAVEHEEVLQLMFAEKMVPRKDIDLLLEECDKQNNITAKAAVLEYAGKNLKPVDPARKFKL